MSVTTDGFLDALSKITGNKSLVSVPNDITPILDRVRQGVFGQESSGNFGTRDNPRTGAAGGFQVLPENVPKWTAKHAGRAMSVDEFKRDPAAQTKVFNGEFGGYLQKALNTSPDEDTAIRKAAAGWYGGEGAMHRYDDPVRFRPDEPSFREYTSNVLRRSKEAGAPAPDFLGNIQSLTKGYPAAETPASDFLSNLQNITSSIAAPVPQATPPLSTSGKPFLDPSQVVILPTDQPADQQPDTAHAQSILDRMRATEPIPTTDTQAVPSTEPQPQPQIPLLTRKDGQQFKVLADHGKMVKVQDAKGSITLQPKRKFIASEAQISSQDIDPETGVIIPPPQQPQTVVDAKHADNAVADTLQIPQNLDKEHASAYVRGQLEAKFPTGDFSKQGFLKNYTPGNPVQVTIGDLKAAGVDTNALVQQKVAENRVENPQQDTTLNTKQPVAAQAEQDEADDPDYKLAFYRIKHVLPEKYQDPADGMWKDIPVSDQERQQINAEYNNIKQQDVDTAKNASGSASRGDFVKNLGKAMDHEFLSDIASPFETAGGLVGGFVKGSNALTKDVYGAASRFLDLPDTSAGQWLRENAIHGEVFSAHATPNTVGGQITNALGVMAPKMLLIVPTMGAGAAVGLGRVATMAVGFALPSMVESYGQGKSGKEIAGTGLENGIQGLAFGGAGVVGKLAEEGLFNAVATTATKEALIAGTAKLDTVSNAIIKTFGQASELGTITASTFVLSSATGAPNPANDATVMAGVDILMKMLHVPGTAKDTIDYKKSVGKIFDLEDSKGNPVPVTITPEGKIVELAQKPPKADMVIAPKASFKDSTATSVKPIEVEKPKDAKVDVVAPSTQVEKDSPAKPVEDSVLNSTDKKMGMSNDDNNKEKNPTYKKGDALPDNFVYHNTSKDALAEIEKHGFNQGAFSDKPIKFGGDTWLAIDKSELPDVQSHQYGDAVSHEPNFVTGYDKDGFPVTSSIPPERLYEVDQNGRVIRRLGGLGDTKGGGGSPGSDPSAAKEDTKVSQEPVNDTKTAKSNISPPPEQSTPVVGETGKDKSEAADNQKAIEVLESQNQEGNKTGEKPAGAQADTAKNAETVQANRETAADRGATERTVAPTSDFKPKDRVQSTDGRKGVIAQDKSGELFVEQLGTKSRIPLSDKWRKTGAQIALDRQNARAEAKRAKLAAKGKTPINEINVDNTPELKTAADKFIKSIEDQTDLKGNSILKDKGQAGAVVIPSGKQLKEFGKAVMDVKSRDWYQRIKDPIGKMIEQHRAVRDIEFEAERLKIQTKQAMEGLTPDEQTAIIDAMEHDYKGPQWNALSAEQQKIANNLKPVHDAILDYNRKYKVFEERDLTPGTRYMYHWWNDPKTDRPYSTHWGEFAKSGPSSRQRTIETYAEGRTRLTMASTNPGEILGKSMQQLMQVKEARDLVEHLKTWELTDPNGIVLKGIVNEPPKGTEHRYTEVNIPALNRTRYIPQSEDGPGLLVKQSVYVVNELTPKIEAYFKRPEYSKLDDVLSTVKSLKLMGSFFHGLGLMFKNNSMFRFRSIHDIKNGFSYLRSMDDSMKILYKNGLDTALQRDYEDLTAASGQFKKGGVLGTLSDIAHKNPMSKLIFGVVRVGLKNAYAHDTYAKMEPLYLKRAEQEAGRALTPAETLKTQNRAARDVVERSNNLFSGEDIRMGALEASQVATKYYFSPESQKMWNRLLISKTWQREHMLEAKNVVKSLVMPKTMGPIAREHLKQVLGVAVLMSAADLTNYFLTQWMDGKGTHLWNNPSGSRFSIRAPWNEPDGAAAYIRPFKAITEVPEVIAAAWPSERGDILDKLSSKMHPVLQAGVQQLSFSKQARKQGFWERAKQLGADAAPISATTPYNVIRGTRNPWDLVPWALGASMQKPGDYKKNPIIEGVRSGHKSIAEGQKELDDALKNGKITAKQHSARSKKIQMDADEDKVKTLHAIDDNDFTNIENFIKGTSEEHKAEVKFALQRKIQNKAKDKSPKAAKDAERLRGLIDKYLPDVVSSPGPGSVSKPKGFGKGFGKLKF